MKQITSFRTTLRMSRHLFRAMALLIWLLGALVTCFYLFMVLHHKEAGIREQLFKSFNQATWHLTHAAEAMRELKYISESRFSDEKKGSPLLTTHLLANSRIKLFPLGKTDHCHTYSTDGLRLLSALNDYIQYWQNQYISSYEINRVYLVDLYSQCLGQFSLDNSVERTEQTLKLLRQHIDSFEQGDEEIHRNPVYWLEPGNQPGEGSYHMLMPVYANNELAGLLSIEQRLYLDELLNSGNLPITTLIVDNNNQVLLNTVASSYNFSALAEIPNQRQWFGYINSYRQLVLKNMLEPGPYSIVYSLPSSYLFSQMKLMIINAILLNVLSGLCLMTLVLLYDRRMLLPAEQNARLLEEHEQFNRKIVASAPVGICILRIRDGSNILSNELAHNYLTLLTREDRYRLSDLIRGKQVNLVDVLTGSNTNLQISFAHSRYRNEDVAICVLVDVSARIKMEQSLQEVAQAAEQANQSKSMFLATVSHELRTPLYGIIGNLELLQTRELPEPVRNLIQGMNNSSSLLLKIINDILDFSKIESEQLKIHLAPYSPQEVITYITSNYLPLVLKKKLSLSCFIEPDIPYLLEGDAIRLQQVLANLVSNAIKFTHTGGILLHLYAKQGYLIFRIRDTGVGIRQRDIFQLFDPFFQVSSSFQNTFQGTGLGLAICEKLVNMMDGDIEVRSELHMGSEFTIRLPIWQGQWNHRSERFKGKAVQLEVNNHYLMQYLTRLLQWHHVEIVTCADPKTILITDHLKGGGSCHFATLCLSQYHHDKPQETQAAHWVMTPAAAFELPAVLGHIWQIKVEEKQLSISQVSDKKHTIEDKQDITVLVVDDHPLNRMLLSRQLSTLGFTIKTANDGQDALAVMKQSEIDIVLTDVNMPNMDGYQFTQTLRNQGYEKPIIGITANAMAEQKQLCLNIGMDDCLSKPITLEQLKIAMKGFKK